MAAFSMQFANIYRFYHYVSFSDSLGIIPCRPKKVGLVKPLRRPIPWRSAQDSWFSCRTEIQAFLWRLLHSDHHCQFSPKWCFQGFFSFDTLHFAIGTGSFKVLAAAFFLQKPILKIKKIVGDSQ
jgi:hypothetical protein